MKILIADDELISRLIVRRAIKNYYSGTAEVEEVADGTEAVEKAKMSDTDVVLMDIEMPGMDGIEAARQIKEWKNSCEIIFLTAFANFQYAREAISIGASEYLVKPVDPEELKQVLERCRKKLEDREKTEESIFGDTEPEEREGETECLGERPSCSSVSALPEGTGSTDLPNSSALRSSDAARQQDAEAGMLTGRAAMIMAQVKQYIELHYMDDLAIDLLAEKFGISVNYFNRIFHSSIGMSAKEYLIHIRVEQAKEYLKNPGLTIREVGSIVGYGDSNYFTRIFKKKTGMTPVEYRNQQFFGF